MSPDSPFTMRRFVEQVQALGVEPGMTLVAHSSLSSLGYVVGGAPAVILGLEQALGDAGTLAMPTHSGSLTDPAAWQDPPVPEAWHAVFREAMPAFRPDLTPSEGMGIIPESFRKQEGALRSYHPFVSWTARGPHAESITADHALSMSSGEGSPLARLYDLAAHVLLIGVSWDRNTSFHLAEYRCRFAARKRCTRGGPVLAAAGGSRWVTYEDIYWYDADFPEIGAAFEATGKVRTGLIGQAACRLFPQRDLVDFAVQWMNAHRSLEG
jgi:aminoglycoside 3-N-acetyltransferase